MSDHIDTIRLVALDVDGTILDSNGRLTSAVNDAIHAAVDRGIQIAIVSGRNLHGIQRVMKMLDLDLLFISSGGAVVSTAFQDPIISQSFIGFSDAQKMIRIARKYHSGIFVEMTDGLYWEGPEYYLGWLTSLTGVPIHIRADLLKEMKAAPLKLTLIKEHQDILEIEAEINAQALDVHMAFSSPNYLEITKKNINKGQALKIMADYLQIPLEQIAAVGDAENDIAMFQVCGMSIAMGNAPENVQRAATLVAPTNDEDGLAWALGVLMKKSDCNG